MLHRKMMWILPLLLVALLVAACNNGEDTTDLGDADAPVEGIPQTDEEAADMAEDDQALSDDTNGMLGDRVEVIMLNTAYEPREITVQPGTTVVWTNEDTFEHTVTSGAGEIADGMFDSGTILSGQTFEYTFDTAGTYEYFCNFHPGMVGTVVVAE